MSKKTQTEELVSGGPTPMTRPVCETPECKNLAAIKGTHNGKTYYRRQCNRCRLDPDRRALIAPRRVTKPRILVNKLPLPPMPTFEPDPFESITELKGGGKAVVRVPYRVMRLLYELGPDCPMVVRAGRAPGMAEADIRSAIRALFPDRGKPRYRI